MKNLAYIVAMIALISMSACRSTKKIQTAISKKDTAQVVVIDNKFDSAGYIKNMIANVSRNHIDFETFSAKVKVDYRGGDGKGNDVNAFIRMKKDSIIWVSINALLGIEAIRILITPDSVKVLNKLDKFVQLRSVSYIQEVSKLPIDFHTLQQLIIGNPVYLDSNIVSFKKEENGISLTSIGPIFKHFITIRNNDYLILNSKLDDREFGRSRTAVLEYNDYETKGNIHFATKRKISVAEKSTLEVNLDFKQFDFNESLNYPFSIPKNFKRN